MEASKVQAIKDSVAAAGQEQILAFMDKLSHAERDIYLAHISKELDFDRLDSVFKAAMKHDKAMASSGTASVEPLPESAFTDSTDPALAKDVEAWSAQGLAAIKAGTVAVVLLAGGQGTRLGSSAPKGCYDVGLPSGKSLFQMQAERIARLKILSGAASPIPWYIMTSPATHSATQAYFKDAKFFGLPESSVTFFSQGTLPAFTPEGKIILESPGVLSAAPDGNGGIYRALAVSGVLDDMKSRGIAHIHVFGVDNVLVRPADPAFIGHALAKGSECSAKSIEKSRPEEPVGILAVSKGSIAIVEYSELPSQAAAARDPKAPGRLALRAANIVNHYYSLAFLTRCATELQESLFHHVARKAIPAAHPETGVRTKPSAPNGVKLEQFIFDVFPHAKAMSVYHVARGSEFSPLKNAPGGAGIDSPESARADWAALCRAWVTAAGGVLEGDGPVDVSPLVSYGGENLADLVGGKTLKTPVVIDADGIHEVGKS